jgi:tetratricopeptide (TPR) repeat protein
MRRVVFTLAVSLTVCLPAGAQGLGEMGGAYAIPKPGGMGGLQNTLGNIYGRAGIPSLGGPNKGVSRGVVSPAARISSEDLAAYTASANKSYTAALAALKAGKKDVALKEFGAALTIRERLWGSADPAVADIARRQAAIYAERGDKAKAEECWRKVLACEQRQFGGGAPELKKTLATLATLCDEQGNNREALSYYRQLYAIQRKAAGASASTAPDPADARPTRLKLVNLLTFTGDFPGAESLLKEAVTVESDNGYQAQLYDAYGALMREMGRDADATAMETKAQSLRGSAPAVSETAPPESAPTGTPAPSTAPSTPPSTPATP